MGELKSSGKSFDISKWEVWEAFQQVKENHGAPGVDGQSVADFEADLKVSVRDSRAVNDRLALPAGAGFRGWR